jgi:hypothetical protein
MPRVSLRGGRFPVVAGRNERGNVSRSVRFGLPPLTTGPLLNSGFEVILDLHSTPNWLVSQTAPRLGPDEPGPTKQKAPPKAGQLASLRSCLISDANHA